MKLKVDNLGCGTCRVKAHADLTRHGAKSIEFDMTNNFIMLDPGPLSREKVIELIEQNTIRVEDHFSEVLVLHVDLNEFAVKELSRAMSDKEVSFDIEAGTISFENEKDEYEVVEIVELYGYPVKRVDKPF